MSYQKRAEAAFVVMMGTTFLMGLALAFVWPLFDADWLRVVAVVGVLLITLAVIRAAIVLAR